MVTTQLTTAEELAQRPTDERFELIRGVLYPMSPIGRPHGRILFAVGNPLSAFVERHDLGYVYGGEIGSILERDPDTVLAPDIAFVRADRVAPNDDGQGYIPFAPELVVEIASPSDSRGALRDKMARYLAAGVRVGWLVEPKPRTVTIFTADGAETVLSEGNILDGGDLLPGFRLPVADIFR